VRASIHTLGGFSAHADQPALLAWTGGFHQPPKQTFVVHGEEAAALAFAQHLHEQRGWAVSVPTHGQIVKLETR
jgi:metallo-beta-lactamase family protein